MGDWHRIVYKPRVDKRFESNRWLKLRERVLERDSYKCQMCHRSFITQLQAHHIKPRRRGGKDRMTNLITLCSSCHDIAEMGSFNKKDILAYHSNIEEEPNNYTVSKDWRKWVYGGYKMEQLV